MVTIPSTQANQDTLLTRINRTIELIRMYDNGIKQAQSLDAPPYLIESKQRMKTQLATELITLLAEMDIQFEMKAAA